MAELNSSAGSLRGGGRTSTLSPRVDMTPMVDLMFLLITFFMLTTTLSRPRAMPVAMPVDGPPGEIADSRTINICLGSNDKILWYRGSETQPINRPQQTSFQNKQLRTTLQNENARAISQSGSKTKGLIVLIKPGDNSNYKNLVDVLDELKISGVQTYFIVKNSKDDIRRMKEKRIY